MSPTSQGSFHLFRFKGINVFLHWSWFLVAYLSYQYRRGVYDSPIWNAYEYLALFGIVLLHEFGHSLACRQTGGMANEIVLWPLGGVAYVAPPPRPGPVLWSIAAGPLVNVALIPIFFGLGWLTQALGVPRFSDLSQLVHAITIINLWLLVFNILPIYPLDGGQILRALLWFPLGQIRSLQIAVVIGFVGVGLLGAYALLNQEWMLLLLAAFMLSNCISGWRYARAMRQQENSRV